MSEARLRREIVINGEDRVGIFADVGRLLADMGISLQSVLVLVDGNRVRIHLLTTSQSYAREALRDAGFSVGEREVVSVEVPHHPGFVCRITEALARREITLYELYATVPETGSSGFVVFTCSNNLHALQTLRGY